MTVVVGSTKIPIQDDGKWNSSEERISFIDKRLNTICKNHWIQGRAHILRWAGFWKFGVENSQNWWKIWYIPL